MVEDCLVKELKVDSFLEEKIKTTSIEMAKEDVFFAFIADTKRLDIWSEDFFLSLIPQILYL